MRSSIACLLLTLSAATLGHAAAPRAGAVAPDAAAIAASIASPDRFEGDRAQDEWRKPDAVLSFLGARPGMKVLDYLAGNGYYTELLGRIVGPTGKAYAYNNLGFAGMAAPGERFANGRVPNSRQIVADIPNVKFDSKSFDAVLFVMAYHDIYWTIPGTSGPMGGDSTKMLAAVYDALKPGGIVVVEDHVANAGEEPAASVDKLHRIDPEVVKKAFEQAGFKFDGESSALRNPADDHTKQVFEPEIQHKTDRFLYRFRKPA